MRCISSFVCLGNGINQECSRSVTPVRFVASLLACGLTLTLSAYTSVQAAAISWGPAFEIASPADIDLSGAEVKAANGGYDGPIMIGGVTFENFTGVNLGSIASSPSFLSVDSGAYSFDQATSIGFGIYSTSIGSTDLDTILSTHVASNTPLTATLSDLTVGQAYRIQLIAPVDERDCCSARQLELDDSGVMLTRYADLDNDSVPHGTSAFGHFVADATTQDFTITGDGGSFSAVVLTTVPEPGTQMLVLLGAMLLTASRFARK